MSKIEGAVGRSEIHYFHPEKLTIVTDPTDPLFDERVKLPLDENMVKNVMVYGVIEPVIVRRDGGDFKVVAGRQRVRWALEANVRLEKEGKEKIAVPCKVERATDDVALGILIAENECRVNDDPTIKALKLQRFMAMGKTEEDAAILFGGKAQVKALLKLLECSPKVLAAVRKDKISVSAAGKLSDLSREEQDSELEELLKDVPEGKKPTFAKVYSKVQEKTGGKNNTYNCPNRREIRKLYDECKDMLPEDARNALIWVLDGKRHGCMVEAHKQMKKVASLADLDDEGEEKQKKTA